MHTPTVCNQSVYFGVCREVFFLFVHQRFLTVWECWQDCCWKTLWMQAGRSLKETLCSFVMQCWDKGSIHRVSPCDSPQGCRPPLTWNCNHTVCLLCDRSYDDWCLCIVRLSVSTHCKGGAGSAMVWSVFPHSSDPLIYSHSPAWEPLLRVCMLSSLCACLHTVCGHVVLKCFSKIRP